MKTIISYTGMVFITFALFPHRTRGICTWSVFYALSSDYI